MTFWRRRLGCGLPRPDPSKPEGTDLIPQIGHIVVLMMENHSYDNYLGMLAGRGDGFTLDTDGNPVESNLTKAGDTVRAHHLDKTSQEEHVPTQSWPATHEQLGDGSNDGFVRSIEDSGLAGDPKVAMGYWTEADLPFYYGLARTFPLADRFYGSCLGPTFPNRRFLLAATANGLATDGLLDMLDDAPNGTIFDLLDAHGIKWVNYHSSDSLRRISFRFSRLRSALESRIQFSADVFPLHLLTYVLHVHPVERFLADARAGTLPPVSIIDPNFHTNSEENPQDIQIGEQFAARVINAAMAGPAWGRTLLIWFYDEHGGYYDHVVPPPAPDPDGVEARIPGGGRFDRYGFRVPAVIVSPYARPGYVSRVTHDHTSVLKLIETKWNLRPLTQRDAAADDLLDSVDFAVPPAFAVPPVLPPPALGLA